MLCERVVAGIRYPRSAEKLEKDTPSRAPIILSFYIMQTESESKMKKELELAIALRTTNKLEDAEKIFNNLSTKYPKNANIQYHFAWLCDIMDREFEAVKLYEKSIRLGLKGANLKGCLLGLGSSYRNIGKLKQSLKVLESAEEQFPECFEFKIFRSMTLFDQGEYNKAFQILLDTITKINKNKGVENYKKAIEYYAKQYGKKF